MSKAFDPYLHWLSIRDPERPPNYYRLLGVASHEDDPDVLAHAARRQIAYVQTFLTGEHAAEAERIVAELGAAAECLANPKAKAVYDTQLQAIDVEKSRALQPTPQEAPVFISTRSLPRYRAYVERKSPGRRFVFLMIAVLLVALGAGITAIFWNIGRRPPVAIDFTHPLTPQTAAQKAAEEQWFSKGAEKAARELEQQLVATPSKDAAPPEPAEAKEPEKTPPADVQPQAPPATPSRYPVPNNEDQAKSQQEIRRVYSDRYAAAKERDDKRSLARVLFQQAKETQDDHTARFVLMSEARDLALDAVDTRLFLDIAAKMGDEYQLNWRTMAAGLAIKAVRTPHDLVGNQSLARMMLELARDEMEQDDYGQAMQLIRTGREVARVGHDDDAVKQFQAMATDLEDRTQLKLQFLEAEKTLAANPNDSQANQIAGRYYCRVKNDWRRGVQLLAKGGETALQKPIEMELADGPRTTADMLALGDLWAEAAKHVARDNQRLARMRAVHWYEELLPTLTGFTRKKIERQISELSE